ncbi:MAG: ADP-glyceromanno-heptose 6-epimerase [Candidatus Omnitrophica bacterium]|nr:ADP-glyceromanno-heptose 6-epimerase [Candidatus Omnitrophota bacterium]
MIILTGGAGFIGSGLLWKLNQEGIEDILVVDSLGSSEKWRNLVGKRFTDFIHKNDFLEMVRNRTAPKPTHVIHMGACSSTTHTDADYYINNNYEYSKELAKWAVASKVPFLYASSAATYGDGSFGYSDSIENMERLKPLNMYGFSKHMFDLWVLQQGLVGKVTGIKFFNVFGPNEYHKGDMRSVVCKAFPVMRDEGVIKLFRSYDPGYADGEQKRDFIYIKDVAEVMFCFYKNRDRTGIYNLGTGRARSWNELAAAMFKAMGMPVNIEYIDMPEHLRKKYQYFTQAETSKLRSSGCDHQFTPLEDAIADYIGYLKEQKYL